MAAVPACDDARGVPAPAGAVRIHSTPIECGRSRETAKRSELAGWASYGYCASHSRFFWGLRLHLITIPAGLPVTWAQANPKPDERQVLMAMLDHDPGLLSDRHGLVILATRVTAQPNLIAS